MSGTKKHQDIPNNWEEREKLREKGQFWTPDWVAQAMISYVLNDSNIVFDPAAGRGAFFEALRKIDNENKFKFFGFDIDEEVLKDPIYKNVNCILKKQDFILNPPTQKFKSIIANPPYIRHHRISPENKQYLKDLSQRITGKKLDGRTGYHVFFLLQALNHLSTNGKLAFIMPADTVEGIFAEDLWNWISKNYCIDCVVTFKSDATPFPNVDTNALVFLICNRTPKRNFYWIVAKKAYSKDLIEYIQSGFKATNKPTLEIINRKINEALKTGLSRMPSVETYKFKLIDFACTMRGIATGANDFFFLNEQQVKKFKIPHEFLKLAIGRTRDVSGNKITNNTIKELLNKNRPVYLFSPDNRPLDEFPPSIQSYLKLGEELGLPNRSLIKQRKPWYKMETRNVPPFLFSYLGRRNSRFILNEANVVPLTTFLCVYPNSMDENYISKLWEILQHHEVLNNLKKVAKSYGSDSLKVEPRKLEQLPIPEILVKSINI